jgi:ribosomal protein L11 methyltransferase
MPGEATDIDPLALQNAEENSGRNHTTEQIHFSNSSVETFPSEHFHLLLANVYAEVLVEMEAEFFRVLRKGGHIFLSGIMASKEEMVLSSYSSPRWVHKESRREGNWWALRFQK